MKVNPFFLILFVPLFLCGQVTENFADGNFTENPIWTGTDSLFSINSQHQLQLLYNTSEKTATQAFLSTKSKAIMNGTWEFSCKITTYTSSANYIRFYLCSDKSDLSGSLNGYFIMIGNTNDEISLYRQQGIACTKIIDGADKRIDLSSFKISVKATCDTIGNWNLFSKLDNETEFVQEGHCNDTVIRQSLYAGFFIKYTSSNVGKYYIDSLTITGEKRIDETFPRITDAQIVSPDKVKIFFSKEISTDSIIVKVNNTKIDKNNYSYNNSCLNINLTNKMESGTASILSFEKTTDLSGNILKNNNITIYMPKIKDVVFNEVFADPNPQVGLPKAKFIELYNRTHFPISLNQWILKIGKSEYKLTNTISPKNYMIICAQNDTASFSPFGKTQGISSTSSITISGTKISLQTNYETYIDWITYSNEWFAGNAFKKDGGWSLERIDPNNFSPDSTNWKASTATNGGTPGQRNSIATSLVDIATPTIKSIAVNATDSIKITFSKEMNISDVSNIEKFAFDNNSIESVIITPPENKTITIIPASELETCLIDTLTILSMHDISGLPFAGCRVAITLPEKPDSYNDIIINEILFNPIENDGSFIELYNPSTHIWNLSEIYITNRKNDALQKRITISEQNELFFQNEYIVLTSSPNNIKKHYPASKNARFANINMPSLPNNKGNVVLLSANNTIFDEFNYDEKMHHSFIKNKKGISLERINPKIPTQNAESWHSAAYDAGYATPGYKNSQYIETNQKENSARYFEPEQKSFSPDNDGYNDIMSIHYKMPDNGYTATLTVFSANGHRIRTLYNNIILSSQGILFWDGTAANGSVCSVGVYIIYIEYLQPSGKKGQQKIICSLTSK